MDSSKLCTCPPRLAMATVPNQEWREPYNWAETLSSNNFYHFNPEFDKRKYNLP